VADFTLKTPAPHKMKRKGDLALELQPTADILGELGALKRSEVRRSSQLLIGFAAETENVLEHAREKLRNKSLDAIVVNDVSQSGIGFDSDRNAVTIITSTEVIEVPETSKWEVAHRVLDIVVRLRESQKYPQTAPARITR